VGLAPPVATATAPATAAANRANDLATCGLTPDTIGKRRAPNLCQVGNSVAAGLDSPEDYRPRQQAMCDLLDSQGLEPLEHDEWVLDTPFVRGFIGDVRAAVAGRPRRRRPVVQLNRASASFSPIRIGYRRSSSRMLRRAGWAAGSANGFSSELPIALSACSALSCRPGR
jgi:hypothetical protein